MPPHNRVTMIFSIILLTTLALDISTRVQASEGKELQCGPGGEITLAGPPAILQLVDDWASAFQISCPQTVFTHRPISDQELIADAVCEDESSGTSIDMGGLTRQLRLGEEAFSSNGWELSCIESSKKLIQVVIGYEVLAIVVKQGSSAEKCIESLPGGGLSADQLRWMFSDMSVAELIATGLPPDAVPLSSTADGHVRTWDKLSTSPNCLANEISLYGLQSKLEYFRGAVFPSDGETFRDSFVTAETSEQVMEMIKANDNAIGIINYSEADFNGQMAILKIQNQNTGEFVEPSTKTVAVSRAYAPFSRPLFMNVNDNADATAKMNPFFEFAFSSDGFDIARAAGYTPADYHQSLIMLTRLQAQGGVPRNQIDCGDSEGTLTIAGDTSVQAVADLWAGIFTIFCSDVNVRIAAEDSDFGVRRACDNGDGSYTESPVDIAMTSRKLRPDEASKSFGFKYACANDENRELLEVEVATDAISIITSAEGRAAECVSVMDGLTVDQLRWIFSDRTEDQMIDDGWSPSSVPNSDGNENTRLWSELFNHPACESKEILIAGPDSHLGAHSSFMDFIFKAEGESFNTDRNFTNSAFQKDVVKYLDENQDAIAFLPFAFVYSQTALESIPIAGSDGNYVPPNTESIGYGHYTSLSRTLYMNVHNNSDAIELARPFFNFGLSKIGQELLGGDSYVAISPSKQVVMHTRLGTKSGFSRAEVDEAAGGCGPASEVIKIAGSETLLPVVSLWAGVYEAACSTEVIVEGGHSWVGAARVCAADDDTLGSPVDIGDMSRDWRPTEGSKTSSSLVKCNRGDRGRSVFQAPVGLDGSIFAVPKGGAAHQCIELLGGLTLDQLRWIYTNYSDKQLEDDPTWDKESVPFSDRRSSTHFWSELDSRCEDLEIRLAGMHPEETLYFNVVDLLFKGEDESIDLLRPLPYYNSLDEAFIVRYIKNEPASIGFIPYPFFFASRDDLVAVALKDGDDGDFVLPSHTNVDDGSYLLSRTLYMNLHNDEGSLQNTLPLLTFAYSEIGASLLESIGYTPVSDETANTVLDNIRDGADSEVEASGLLKVCLYATLVLAVVMMCFLVSLTVQAMRDGRDSQLPIVSSRAPQKSQE